MKKTAIVLALVAAASSACTEEPPPPPPAASSARPAATATASAAAPATESSITSSSPEAVEAFKKGRDHVDNLREADAVEQFKKAVALDPGFALAHAYLGYYTPGSEGKMDPDAALALSDKIPAAERLVIEELRALHVGDADKALTLAERVVALTPFDWHAQFDLGVRLYAARRLDDAAEALKRAAAFGPVSYAVYNELGYVQLDQHKYDAAAATFRRYTELRADEPNSFDSLGEALMSSGHLEEAEKSFTKAAGMKFSFSWSGVAYCRFLRGDAPGGMEALGKSRDAATRWSDKLDVDVIAIWASMLSAPAVSVGGTPTPPGDAAQKRIDALEKDAQEQKVDEPYALAPVLRAVALAEAGKADPLKDIGQAVKRGEHASLPGKDMNLVRRAALVWSAVIQAKLGAAADAEKTAAALEEEAKKAGSEPDVASMATLGRGAAAFAKGDAAAAARELSACLEDDFVCRYQLYLAQQKKGDTAGAAATRDKVLKANLRDPAYLYVRAKLAK
jgi:tetratricopeptide (TPR) repeat protein